VHPSNPVVFSLHQLKAIYEGSVKNWMMSVVMMKLCSYFTVFKVGNLEYGSKV
jgi:hypothetical protein